LRPAAEDALRQVLEAVAALQGREVLADTEERLAAYVEELHAYNQTHRIVGAASQEEIARQHVADSLALLRYAGSPLVDVGSGAGLPGLVLALAAPELTVTLIEPRNKPAAFLSAMRARFGLTRMMVLDRRVEDVTIADLAGSAPARCVVAKGFGPLEKLVRAARHLAAPYAWFLVPSSAAACAPPGEALEHGLVAGRRVHRQMLGLDGAFG
jgi:16S rRNA (guanine527-N7)-methyltransferase